MQHTSVTIPAWAQGRTGLGQGGYTAAQFEHAVGQALSISLRAPIPLATEMGVIDVADDAWELRSGEITVMSAQPSTVAFAGTDAVGLDAAAQARTRSNANTEEHVAPDCRSCGTGELSMRVWPGPLEDGTNRVATDWIPPSWADDGNGQVLDALVWMALDCTSGFFLGMSAPGADGKKRNALTVQFAAQVLKPLIVGEPYVTVGFDGTWTGGWDGRKRGAGASVFDRSGELVAQAESFWVAVPEG